MTYRGRRIDRALLKRVGRPCTWEKGLLCPNLGTDGQHPAFCPYCASGRGYQYVEPQTINVLFSSDQRNKEFDLAGAWERGECEATVEAHHPIGDQDRITIHGDPVRYPLLVERGSGDEDALRAPWVEELVAVQGVDASYVVDTDCQVSTSATSGDAVLKWLTATRPAAGAQYSVLVTIRPVWIVRGDPMIRAFGSDKSNQIPLRIKLQRFDRAVTREV